MPAEGLAVHELVPPTVPVPLADLTGDTTLGLRQTAGPSAAQQPVYSVHTSEMADPRPYLLGGELLLSAGVHCQDGADAADDTYWDRYVRRAVEAHAAALGFGVAPVHDTVPEALAEACTRHGLPLLEVPRRTPFAAVARAVWQLMGERRHAQLRRLSEAQHTLAAAAAKPHPVRAVLRQLAQHLDAFAALYGPDGSELATAGAPPCSPVRAELAALTGQLRTGPSSAASSHGADRLSAYGLGARGRFALGLSTRQPGGTDAAVASVAVVLLSLLTEPRTAATDARRSAALVRLMLGAPAAEAAPLLGDPRQRWTVVHGKRSGATGDRRAGQPPASTADLAAARAAAGAPGEDAAGSEPFALSELAAGLGSHLLDVDGDQLRALVPSGEPVDPQPGWILGAAAPVPPDELGDGDAAAARALRQAVAERRTLVQQRGDGGGVGGGLAGLIPEQDRKEHAHALLAPLEERPELVETLRMWLSLHGSWDRTAVALAVHRNTVRQRIARAGALLGLELAEQDARMELWFALRWC